MRRLVLFLLPVLLLAGCASSVHSRTMPAEQLVDPGTSATASVVATWTPDMNDRGARPVTTHGSAQQARALLAALGTGSLVAKGSYSCPADFGVAVRLTFAGGPTAQVGFTGCAWATVAHRQSRWIDAQLDAALRPIAPKAWQRYLT